MSERYGTLYELEEILGDLEEWVRQDIKECVLELKLVDALGDPRYNSGRLSALRDVLSFLRVDDA